MIQPHFLPSSLISTIKSAENPILANTNNTGFFLSIKKIKKGEERNKKRENPFNSKSLFIETLFQAYPSKECAMY